VDIPDLNDVRTFVAIGREGTLTAAARELGLPTSTVSRALTRLEKHLDVLLVQRSPRGLVLTDFGKEYLQTCRRALRTLRDGSELLESHRERPSGLIKVACPITMARSIFAPLLKEFLERYPELRVEIEPYSSAWDQEPREDVDVFFKVRAPRDSVRRVGLIQERSEDCSQAQITLRRAETGRSRRTCGAHLHRFWDLEVEPGDEGRNSKYRVQGCGQRPDCSSRSCTWWLGHRHPAALRR
jgi:DNA-binding transcriptional LysR family regulator